jgi:hypothetical protein
MHRCPRNDSGCPLYLLLSPTFSLSRPFLRSPIQTLRTLPRVGLRLMWLPGLLCTRSCPGVAYLHSPERRIAHRDIKPRNILLDTSGTAVVIDFGVAYSSAAGPRDIWPEPEGKMYFEVGSGCVFCLSPILGRYRSASCLGPTAHQSFFLARASTTRWLATCGLSALLLQSSSLRFTEGRYPMTTKMMTSTEERGDPRRHICLMNCPGRGRPLNGNVILYSMARVATSVSRGAFSAFAAHQHQKTGPFVFLPRTSSISFWRVFSCVPH